MSFLAPPRLGEHGCGISRALMRRVRAPLAVKVDRRVATIIGWRSRRRFVLRTEALEAGRSFDQRAVDGEVFIAQQPQPSCLAHHFVEELLGHVMLEQPLAVLSERGRVEAW